MGLTVQVSNLSEGKSFFSSPQCPEWLWGPLSLMARAWCWPLISV